MRYTVFYRGMTLVVIAAFICLAFTSVVRADTTVGPGWVGGSSEASIQIDSNLSRAKSCEDKQIYVAVTDRKLSEPYIMATVACVYTNGGTEYTSFYWLYAGQSGAAIKLRGDDFFRKLGDGEGIYSPSTDVLVYGAGDSTRLTVVRNISENIVLSNDRQGEPTKYVIPSAAEEQLPSTQSGYYYSTSAYALSENGRYIAAYVDYKGIIKIDLQTGEEVSVLKYIGSWTSGSRSMKPRAVSDDGRFIALGPNFKVVDTQDCGWSVGGVFNAPFDHDEWCEMEDFTQRIRSVVGYEYTINYARFTDNDFTVEFMAEKMPGVQISGPAEPKHLTVKVGATKIVRLDYLALGDSYSSGEGDNGILFGEKYYREGTDENGPPREKCHISTRSYPFLLAKAQGLENRNWNTIACSGALIEKDYHGADMGYAGQGDRLNSLTSNQIEQYKTDAKNDFIPGRVKQIEFVKKYKPKVITITGSGNDVGFSDVLATCVDPFRPDDTCTYAGDSRGKSMLGQAIQKQYDNVRQLVGEIRKASPYSIVYYVGYPQFLKATDNSCKLGVSLSVEERRTMRTATTYLNRIIKSASESEGAVYIDIENALGDHLLCGEDPYVTGYNADCGSSFARLFRGKDECQESFHPKPAGHSLITSAILKSHPNIMQDQPCAPPRSCTSDQSIDDIDVPKLFKDAYEQDAKADRVPVHNGVELAAQKGNRDANIYATAQNVEPDSKFNVYVTSDPMSLGEMWSDAEGNLLIDKAVPESLPAGYHTLHAEGNDSSGGLIELWWIIRIFGKDGDIDEDGLPDSIDKCIFMPTLGIDKDEDGVDDGCDSSIGDTGQWLKYVPPFKSDTTGEMKSFSHADLVSESVSEKSDDNRQGQIRLTGGNVGSVKQPITKEQGVSGVVLPAITVGIGLVLGLLVTYVTIKRGKANTND